MDELDTTHGREEPMATKGDQDWGAKREGPPQTEHAAE
jgi:NADH-quinone oxidoreductase subunit I